MTKKLNSIYNHIITNSSYREQRVKKEVRGRGATQTEATAKVNQGYLEASNINVVTEMVDMISIARDFESNQKIMNTIDEMLGKMVSISEI